MHWFLICMINHTKGTIPDKVLWCIPTDVGWVEQGEGVQNASIWERCFQTGDNLFDELPGSLVCPVSILEGIFHCVPLVLELALCNSWQVIIVVRWGRLWSGEKSGLGWSCRRVASLLCRWDGLSASPYSKWQGSKLHQKETQWDRGSGRWMLWGGGGGASWMIHCFIYYTLDTLVAWWNKQIYGLNYWTPIIVCLSGSLHSISDWEIYHLMVSWSGIYWPNNNLVNLPCFATLCQSLGQ